jgi:hypothetical protein
MIRLALSCCVPLVLLAGWGFWLEPAGLRNEDHRLVLDAWPATCDGLRVAVLADLHTGSPWNDLAKLAEIVDLTNRARPDLILLAGDFVIHDVVGGRFVAPEASAAALAELSAPLGVFAVLGNHDWWLDGPRVQRALESAGITVLEDTATRVAAGRCSFWLAGISDYWERPHDVQRALAEVPATASVIAFSHNPDVFPEVPERVAITFAGHTHGGQVYLPGIGRPIVPSKHGERFAIGHVVEDGRHLFVSSGLGTSILPVRFLVPPEISVVELFGPAEVNNP